MTKLSLTIGYLLFNYPQSSGGNSVSRSSRNAETLELVSVNLCLIGRSLAFSLFGLKRLVSVQIHGHRPPMDPSAVRFPPSVDQEEDEWDTDGFVIPSLGIADSDQSIPYAPNIESSNSPAKAKMEEENIYLGPHGAPPSQSKQQELNSSSRKQRLKQKLKDADKRISGTGRENKLDNLRELVGGGGKESSSMAKGSPKDWLDPHCHEAQFERRLNRSGCFNWVEPVPHMTYCPSHTMGSLWWLHRFD